jgi:hypothetical protein
LRAAQGKELPANAKATSNDTAVASAIPNATATGRGKPSDLMAFSPQPSAGSRLKVAKLLFDFGGIMI